MPIYICSSDIVSPILDAMRMSQLTEPSGTDVTPFNFLKTTGTRVELTNE